jgi:anaphase-promoting complex subunit 2
VEQSRDAKSALRTPDVEDALEYLLVGDGQSQSEDGNEEGLVEWYTNEATLHFAVAVRPALTELWKKVRKFRHGIGSWTLADVHTGN